MADMTYKNSMISIYLVNAWSAWYLFQKAQATSEIKELQNSYLVLQQMHIKTEWGIKWLNELAAMDAHLAALFRVWWEQYGRSIRW